MDIGTQGGTLFARLPWAIILLPLRGAGEHRLWPGRVLIHGKCRGTAEFYEIRSASIVNRHYENETLGASFCSGLSTTNISAAVKLNVFAMRFVGNVSRAVL